MEREHQPRGVEGAPSRHHADASCTSLPRSGDVFVAPVTEAPPHLSPSDPEPAPGCRILWELIEEEMQLRGLTLARYRDGERHSISEHLLQRLVAYFGQLPWTGGDPLLPGHWLSTDDIRARIADRTAYPDETALRRARIFDRGSNVRATENDLDDSQSSDGDANQS